MSKTRKPIYISSQIQLAAFFGLSQDSVKLWLTQGCPEKTDKGYDLFEVCKWWAEVKVARLDEARAKRDAERKREESTEELKRRRLEQQIRADELKYAMQVGTVIPVEHVQTAFNTSSQHISQAGDILRKQFGADAQQILNDALAASEKVAEQLFDDSTTATGT